jgi:hypothetical protein
MSETGSEFTRYQEQEHTGGPEPERSDPGVLEVLPGLARLGAVAWWRGTQWSVETSVRVGTRLVRFAASGQAPADVFRESGTDLRMWLRRFLDLVDESGHAAASTASDGFRGAASGQPADDASANGQVPLRERGAELLRKSQDVHHDDDEHPAYERILQEMAPDEARILRHMCQHGPQAAVDVRTGGPIGMLSSQLIAPGLTMVAREAGARRPERVHQYLNNLHRLGMIWFSRETLEDQAAYQVLEAQPEVVEATEEVNRARTVRRSIHLTPFGEDFCKAALPLETSEIDALPQPGPDDEPIDAELA